MLRSGYSYEESKEADRNNVLNGYCGGFTIEIPINKEKGTTFGLDYSYRASYSFQGCHSIGARINL